jgi:hypothetical protein
MAKANVDLVADRKGHSFMFLIVVSCHMEGGVAGSILCLCMGYGSSDGYGLIGYNSIVDNLLTKCGDSISKLESKENLIQGHLGEEVG